jgi:hypothetical protein
MVHLQEKNHENPYFCSDFVLNILRNCAPLFHFDESVCIVLDLNIVKSKPLLVVEEGDNSMIDN